MLALLTASNGLLLSRGAPTTRAPQHAVSTLSMAADGPVCIVTGGSRGLGRAIALALGGEGCRVVVNYAASAAAAEEVVKEIKALGGDGVAVQADMSTIDGIKVLFKATAEAYDEPVGVLVNNAGITRDTLVRAAAPHSPARARRAHHFHYSHHSHTSHHVSAAAAAFR